MSQDRAAELALRAVDAWNRGDLETFVATTDPGVAYRTSGVFPGTEAEYRGHEGVQRFWASVHDLWQDLTLEVVEVAPRDPDWVVVLMRFHGSARGGMRVDRPFAFAIAAPEDLILSLASYADWDDALAAPRPGG
jgi:hypothetical protein